MVGGAGGIFSIIPAHMSESRVTATIWDGNVSEFMGVFGPQYNQPRSVLIVGVQGEILIFVTVAASKRIGAPTSTAFA